MDRPEVLVEGVDRLGKQRSRPDLLGHDLHPAALGDVVGVVVRSGQGDDAAVLELEQPLGVFGLSHASDELHLLAQVSADGCVRSLQLRCLPCSLSEESLAIVEAGELHVRLVRIAFPVRRGLLGELLLHAAKRRLALGQEPSALADRRGAAAGVTLGDVDCPLLDQVHDSAQVAADHLQPLDAPRLRSRSVQGLADVADERVCAVEEIDGRAPREELARGRGARTDKRPLQRSDRHPRGRHGTGAAPGLSRRRRPEPALSPRQPARRRPHRRSCPSSRQTANPPPAFWLKVTFVPTGNDCSQSPGQSIPAGSLETLPPPSTVTRRLAVLARRRRGRWSARQVDRPAVGVARRVGVPGAIGVRRRDEEDVEALARGRSTSSARCRPRLSRPASR